MDLLTSMSVAGSVPMLMYCLLKLTGREEGSAVWERRFLRLAMFFFLCPFQHIKYLLPVALPEFMYHTDKIHYLNRVGYVVVPDFLGDASLMSVWKILLTAAWLLGALGFISFQCVRYIRLKRSIQRTSNLMRDESKQTEASGSGKKVRYLQNGRIRTPFTIGIRKPWIVFPEQEFTEESEKMIVLHEMTHIKNKDLLFKFICLGICVVHWFNPFAWLLLYEYGVVSEKICDEQVTVALKTREERKKYASLLLMMAVREKRIPVMFADHFSGDGKEKEKMKKRIDRILYPKQRKTGALPILLTAVVLISSTTAIAYEIPWSAQMEEFENASDREYLVPDTVAESWLEKERMEEENVDFSESDYIFVDEKTGIKTNLSPEQIEKERAACVHTFREGYVYSHILNGTGGCTRIQYSARLCTKCNYYIIGKEVSRASYNPCPH